MFPCSPHMPHASPTQAPCKPHACPMPHACPLHAPCKPHACPMHAPCKPHASPMHATNPRSHSTVTCKESPRPRTRTLTQTGFYYVESELWTCLRECFPPISHLDEPSPNLLPHPCHPHRVQALEDQGGRVQADHLPFKHDYPLSQVCIVGYSCAKACLIVKLPPPPTRHDKKKSGGLGRCHHSFQRGKKTDRKAKYKLDTQTTTTINNTNSASQNKGSGGPHNF